MELLYSDGVTFKERAFLRKIRKNGCSVNVASDEQRTIDSLERIGLIKPCYDNRYPPYMKDEFGNDMPNAYCADEFNYSRYIIVHRRYVLNELRAWVTAIIAILAFFKG